MAERTSVRRTDEERAFYAAAVLFGVALALHAVDHLRRGMDVIPPAVMIAGMFQMLLAATTLVGVALRR